MNHEDPDHSQPELTIVTIRPGLHITQSCFRVGARHFEFKSLHDLQTRQSSHDPLTRHSALLAVGGLVVLVPSARFLHAPGLLASCAVLLGLVVLSLSSAHRRPRRMELWARHRGRPTRLFVSDDWWLFTSVERHLRKALTDNMLGYRSRPPRGPRPAVPHPSMVHPSRMSPGGMAPTS
ncbi:DUF6232 family protein [Rhizocola hellebori]|uniref:DUF6232 family protein n=1 Tax=Rhizocola hellebori TaxID=1392758 RepID=UPI0019448B49|nr:DUF6232 family protein [Rhizocola hellebori]